MIIHGFDITETTCGFTARSLANPLITYTGRTAQDCLQWITKTNIPVDNLGSLSELNNQTHDPDIRKVLPDWLKSRYPGIFVTHELDIAQGRARIDIAGISDKFIGIEIKSNTDTLSRLTQQIKAYNLVFDYIYLAVGSKHFNKAMKIIPEFWGVLKTDIYEGKDEVQVSLCREPKLNPKVDLKILSLYLWKDDMIFLLKQFGETGLSDRNCTQLRNKVLELVNPDILRRYIFQCIIQHRTAKSIVNF